MMFVCFISHRIDDFDEMVIKIQSESVDCPGQDWVKNQQARISY